MDARKMFVKWEDPKSFHIPSAAVLLLSLPGLEQQLS